jgi:3-isopropylmalate/(R)-2-methylmalate dehydratase large subunit
MGLTVTEKIFSERAGRVVKPGEFVEVEIDIALANDITAPIAIKRFEELYKGEIYNKDKIVLVPDHFTPNKDINSANQVKILRDFAKKHNLKYYFELGDVGVEHALLPEKGIVVPGDIVIGADSHTCTYGALGAFATGVGSTDFAAAMIGGKAWFKIPETIKFMYNGKLQKWVDGKDLILYTIGKIGVDGALYKVMEFSGEVIKKLPMHARFTMCNMAIEAGGKAGIIEPDTITEAYVKGRAQRTYKFFSSDENANYSEVINIDVSDIEPQVAFPHLPENSKPVREAKGIKIDQVFIGSCTNGRLEDLRIAADILKGNKVAKYIRVIIIPATQKIYMDALKEGLIEIFINSGAVVSTPTCGPCLGGHMGILAKGEKAIATSNRNFVGRMGDPESEVYLSNPAVAAASAITGYITHPGDIKS